MCAIKDDPMCTMCMMLPSDMKSVAVGEPDKLIVNNYYEHTYHLEYN